MKNIIIAKLLLLSITALANFDQEHRNFTEVLRKYTKNKALQTSVDYKRLKANKKQLQDYLDELEAVTPSDFKLFSRNQKLAFWINTYNAYTLDLIIRHYPLTSIKDIGGIFGRGPWKRRIVKVLSKKLTLNNVEHDIIRKNFKEPRIHFAVNCASVGCPSLLQEAFTGNKLEKQLALAAKNFLDNKNKNYYKNSTLYLSKIFDWYGEDFAEKYGSYKKFVKNHYNIKGDLRVRFLNYNWSLNDY